MPWACCWNEGNGRFSDGTTDAGVEAFGWRAGAAVGDVNADGWPDLFVANDGTPNHLWLNQGGARFVESALMSAVFWVRITSTSSEVGSSTRFHAGTP